MRRGHSLGAGGMRGGPGLLEIGPLKCFPLPSQSSLSLLFIYFLVHPYCFVALFFFFFFNNSLSLLKGPEEALLGQALWDENPRPCSFSSPFILSATEW